jgi:tRNA dimethylallyltransferase
MRGMKKLPKVLVVVGPTATGKSDLAVILARRFHGEIVSADSRQIYHGLDIGSGKVTKREMYGIPHHMLDIESPKRVYNVERYRAEASRAVADIISRGKLPIICGGTGFYVDALIHDERFPAVAPDKTLRARLAKRSPESLMKMLHKLDARRAREMDPHNKVRIIRAIEIARALGNVPKVKRKNQYDVLWIGLHLSRPALREKIHTRLMRRMKSDRIVAETRRLRAQGVSWRRLHEFGLEYRHVGLYLQKKLSKTEMLEKLEREIVDFSKRQMTWFGRNRDIKWFAPTEVKKITTLTSRFLKQ